RAVAHRAGAAAAGHSVHRRGHRRHRRALVRRPRVDGRRDGDGRRQGAARRRRRVHRAHQDLHRRGDTDHPAESVTEGHARRWTLLAILTTAYGAGAFGMLGISPLTPSLVEGFGLTRFQVAFIVPSIYLAGLLFSLPGGRLADRLGVRPAFLGGLAVAAVGLLAAALAPGFLAFLVCLFVAGSGWSVVNPALGKAIMDVFP